MILSILFLFLFTAAACTLLFVLFYFLLPALKNYTTVTGSLIFSEQENTTDSGELLHAGTDNERKRAVVHCSCDRDFEEKRLDYTGIRTCLLFNSVYTTPYDCKWGCIGFGDCRKVCPQQAIEIKNNTAIITELCDGCGRCVDICPKKLISLVPVSQETVSMCNAANNSRTGCKMYRKEQKNIPFEKKSFKFWLSCYKILNRS